MRQVQGKREIYMRKGIREAKMRGRKERDGLGAGLGRFGRRMEQLRRWRSG